MSKKSYHFYCETYGENFYFAPEWSKKYLSEFTGVSVGSENGKCLKNEQGVLIWVEKYDLKNLHVLMHECIHAANYVLHDRGVVTTTDNDEALAYLAEFVFKSCMKVRLKR